MSIKKISLVFLGTIIFISNIFLVNNTSVNAGKVDNLNANAYMDQELIKELNDYVSYNDSIFIVKEQKAKENLSDEKFNILMETVKDTNKSIKELENNNNSLKLSDEVTINEIEFIDPKNEKLESDEGRNQLTYKEGVTKGEIHWWGFRIYLSKTAVNNIGAGVALVGIWIPEPVVSKVLASLGVLAGVAPGGIVFDITPLPPYIPRNAKFQ